MKKLQFSRTFWVNIIAMVIIIATALADPTLISPQVATIATTVLAVANIALRTVTNTAIDLSFLSPNPAEDE